MIELAHANRVLQINFTDQITTSQGDLVPIYFDWRNSGESPELMNLISDAIYEKMWRLEVDVIVGVANGGSLHADWLASRINHKIAFVRPKAEPKGHGFRNVIEGAMVKDRKVFVIEDVLTTGTSLEQAIWALKKEGAIIVKACAIYARNRNIIDVFNNKGIKLDLLLDLNDFSELFNSIFSPEDHKAFNAWIYKQMSEGMKPRPRLHS